MKKSLFLYLFVLAVLLNVFTYAYFSRKGEADMKQSEIVSKKQNDSILVLYNKLQDADYFSLENNLNAQDYFEKYEPKQVIDAVTGKIMDMNDNQKGNVLVPFEQIHDQKFIVNKVRVLNHRWVICDFSDGTTWGELLLKYFVEDDGSITFERIDSQLYYK